MCPFGCVRLKAAGSEGPDETALVSKDQPEPTVVSADRGAIIG